MYKLSNRAADDFEGIFEYTLLNFGIDQADSYTNTLHNVLLTISKQPLMGYACSEIKEGMRRHDHNKHAIFYRIESYGVFVVRILHHQMEPLKHIQTDF